jgi:hypothetical protein
MVSIEIIAKNRSVLELECFNLIGVPKAYQYWERRIMP